MITTLEPKTKNNTLVAIANLEAKFLDRCASFTDETTNLKDAIIKSLKKITQT